MSRIIRTLLLASALVAFSTLSSSAEDRIATVDLRKIFDGYWRTKQANAALKERGEEMEREFNGLVKDLETAQEEYRSLLESANDQAVSVTERERRKKKAEEKLKQLNEDRQTAQQFRAQASETIQEQNRRVRDKILEEITAVITALANSGNFTLVFDTAAETPNRTKLILYSSNPNDLTDAVLNQLNATAPPDSEEDTSE